MRTMPALRAVSGMAIVAALAVTAACSNSTGNSAGDSAPAKSSGGPIKSMLFVNPLPNYPAWKVIGDCMRKEAEKKGVTFSQAGPTGSNIDTQKMLDEMQQGIANKVDAIATFPVSAKQFDPVFQQARNAGLYVATVEGGQTENQNVNIGTSFEQMGQLAAKTVAGRPGKQNVGFLTSQATGPDAVFVKSFETAAKQYPNIKIVDNRYDGGNVTKTVDIAVAMMTAHPELNHFVTDEGADTPGITAAIKQKKAVGHVVLTSNSIYTGGKEGIKDGTVYSLLLQNMCQIGSATADSLIGVSKGQKVSANVVTQILYATKSNLDSLTASGEMQ